MLFFYTTAQINSAKMHIQKPEMHLNLCKQTIWSHSHIKGSVAHNFNGIYLKKYFVYVVPLDKMY